MPKAFIESAWRRYTKHSRNKTQELQSAIVPLSQRYHEHHPFLGVVLGGVFTSGSLTQLRSHGFSILYIPYESIVATFKNGGVDVSFDESTSTPQLQRKVNAYERLSQRKRGWIAGELAAAHHSELRQFLDELESSLGRALTKIVIIPLSGQSIEVRSVDEAVGVVTHYEETAPVSRFFRYEIYATYSNGDTVHGQFQEKQTAIEFIANLGRH